MRGSAGNQQFGNGADGPGQAGLDQLQAELARARETIERQGRDLDRLKEALQTQDQQRRAMLFLLEDLEDSRREVESAREEWSAAFDSVDELIFIRDADFRIVRANRAYEARAGMDVAELAGRRYWEVFPRMDGPLPGDRGGGAADADPEGGELVLDSGEAFISRIYPIPGPEGRAPRAVHVLVDVTGERRAAERERRMASVLDQSAQAIGTIDAQERFDYVNRAFEALFGFRREEILGRHVSAIWPAREDVPTREVLERAKSGEGWLGEVLRRTADGTEVPILLTTGPLNDARGALTGQMATFTDLRPVKAFQERLQLLNDVIQGLSTELDLEQLARKALEAVVEALGYDFGGIALPGEQGQVAYRWVFDPDDEGRRWLEQLRLRPNEGAASLAMGTGRIQALDDYAAFAGAIPEAVERDVRSAVSVPVRVGDRIKGAMTLATRGRSKEFDLSFGPLLEAVAQQLGVGLRREELAGNLAREREHLHDLVQSMDAVVCTLAPDGEVRFVSQAVERITGYTPEEVRASNWWELFYPGELSDQVGRVQALMEEGDVRDHSMELRHREGGTRVLSWNSFNRRDPATDRLLEIRGVGIDITERVRAERRLHSQTELNARLVENIPLSVFWKDAGLVYQGCNQAFAEKAGLRSAGAIVGKTDFDLPWTRDQAEAFRRDDREVLDSGRPKPHIEEPVLQADGTQAWLLTSKVPLRENDGQVSGVLGIFADITEKKRNEASLQRLNRALTAVSRCNEVLVHSEDEQDLLGRICAILCEEAGYALVSVSYAAAGPESRLRRVARAGIDSPLDACLEPGAPSWRACFRGEAVIVQDFATRVPDARFAVEALEAGLRSGIAVPLMRGGASLGALTLASTLPARIDAQEAELLGQLAADLAFGITALREREASRRAQDEVIRSEQQLRAIVDRQGDAVLVVDPEGAIRFANPTACSLLGQPEERLLGSPFGLPAALGESSELELPFSGRGRRRVEMRSTELRWMGDPAWLVSLHDITDRHALEAERQAHEHSIQDLLVSTIRAIARTVEKRDPYTAGHQERVADLGVAIGREMGLDEGQCEGIRLGGLIHDIGKVYVPAEILARPGRLSELEYNIIKAHPEIGFDIVRDVDFPWPVAEMIRQHHERLDGSGYPLGLQGQEIIREARILAVADVVEAMTSHRPYRAGLGLEAALEEVTSKSGTLFDPGVVDAALRVFDGGYVLEAPG